MRTRVLTAVVAACVLGSSLAWSACPPGQSRNCVDLATVPQISREIVAGERIATSSKTAPVAEAKPAYTGPTIGLSRTVRQAPMVGYRWSID